MNRRSFLSGVGALASLPTLSSSFLLRGQSKRGDGSNSAVGNGTPADHTLRIEDYDLEISPGVVVKTTAFNGQVPGPMLSLKADTPVTIDVSNNTQRPDLTHWHGLRTDVRNDGAMEEGSPMIQPGETVRYQLKPNPTGTRWYHTHNMAMDNLSVGTYSGQFGFLIVEGKALADFDQEFYLAVHHWEPKFIPMVMTLQAGSTNHPSTTGSDVGYKYATINSHQLGAGEPLRVKKGQRVLLHILNASATENVLLALPGHTFKVLAMDGNQVSNPRAVETLSIAVAERIDCLVEMNNPGVWILGSTLPAGREMGLGIVVEYADAKGRPAWKDPAAARWDYGNFALKTPAKDPDKTYRLDFVDIGPKKDPRFDTITINGKSWPDTEPLMVEQGKRYRLLFQNLTGDQHPMHLHRHSFEVAGIDGQPMSGLIKDTVNVMPSQQVTIDFVADNPGDSLYHCHMQLHMDYGFMGLIRYL
jgi:FtsP/CotA-like multicopper oxidase with cupredoxin domain